MSTEKVATPKTARTGWYRVELVRPNDQTAGAETMVSVTGSLIYVFKMTNNGGRATLADLEDVATGAVHKAFANLAEQAPEIRRKAEREKHEAKVQEHLEALEEMGACVEISWPEDADEEAVEADEVIAKAGEA